MTAKITSPSSGDQDITRVRDILLGPQMRELDQRFQLLQRDVDRLQKLLDQMSEQMQEQTEAHGLRLVSQLSEQDARFTTRLQEENSRTKSQFEELNERLKYESAQQAQRMNQEAERFDKQLTNLETGLTKKLQGIQREARINNDDLRAEMRELVDNLMRTKTDRHSLGQMLMEIGNQLIGSNEALGFNELLAGVPAAEE